MRIKICITADISNAYETVRRVCHRYHAATIRQIASAWRTRRIAVTFGRPVCIGTPGMHSIGTPGMHSEERKVQALYFLVVGKSPQAPLKTRRPAL